MSEALKVAGLRPGVVVGRYPQRHDGEPSAFERLAAATSGAIRQLAGGKTLDDAAFIERVNALRRRLARAKPLELERRANLLRRKLGGLGFGDENTAEAFALVREIAGRVLGYQHYDVQLLAGRSLLHGHIAEMQTGEGKTLTATLPAASAALAGIPVHIVSANDYLVQRDAETMAPIYEALGLSVGVIYEGLAHRERKIAYSCDIVYCTNKQLAFDYLRDRLVFGQRYSKLGFSLEGLYAARSRAEDLLLRGLCYAIVDEADSIFIDEARTPLILSRPGDTVGGTECYSQALAVARGLRSDRDYMLDRERRIVEFTESGRERLQAATSDLDGLWRGRRRAEQLVRQALTAIHYYLRDVHYLVRDGKVMIIDEYTGRVMPDRSWEQGLHQLIEAKEDCEPTEPPETLARISYQRFFRRYLHLAGMTGTCVGIEGELWSVYRRSVQRVPTHKPSLRRYFPSRLFMTRQEKWHAVVERAMEMIGQRRAVLVGTRSVADSQALSDVLTARGIDHRVLNAAQDHAEAEIIAQAGKAGRVTVATNMAGRGTDIELDDVVRRNGGLHVVATERHHAERIDRQLFGRCARQGDPGSAEFVLSLEDELLSEFYPAAVRKRFMTGKSTGQCLSGRLVDCITRLPQMRAESVHAQMRRHLQKSDEALARLLSFGGSGE